MSVSGVSSSSFANYNQSIQPNMQQFRQEFQQLGQDLQSGNLSAAQTDFATLQQLRPQANSTSSAQNNNPIAQSFNQLSQELKSGNLSAAQQDYATLQQDFQKQSSQVHHHHHHHGGGHGESAVSQLLVQLGQDLRSGNVSAAQQVYSTLMQDLPLAGQNSASGSASQSSQSSTNGVSMIA
jgi:uncharacterized protein YukE